MTLNAPLRIVSASGLLWTLPRRFDHSTTPIARVPMSAENFSKTVNFTASYRRLGAVFVGVGIARRLNKQPGDSLAIVFGNDSFTGTLQSNYVLVGPEIRTLIDQAKLVPGQRLKLTATAEPPHVQLETSTEEHDVDDDRRRRPNRALTSRQSPDSETTGEIANEISEVLNEVVGGRAKIFCVSIATGPTGTHGGVNTASSQLVQAMNTSNDFDAVSAFTDAAAGDLNDDEISIYDRGLDERIDAARRAGKIVWVLGHGRWTGEAARTFAATRDLKRAHFVHTAPSQTAAARNLPGEGGRALAKIRAETELLAGAHARVFVGNSSSDFLPNPEFSGDGVVEGFLFPVAAEPAHHLPARLPVVKILISGRLEDGDVKGVALAKALVAGLSATRTQEGARAQLIVVGADAATEADLLEWGQTQQPCVVTVLPFLSRDDLLALVRTSSLTLLPSTADALGLAAVESIAFSRPALVSDLAGVATHFRKHGRGDWVLDPSDTEAWVGKAAEILQSPAIHENAAADGRRLAEQIYADAKDALEVLARLMAEVAA